MKKKGIILLVGIFLFSFTFISANTFGYNYLDNKDSVVSGLNYSINVNNSDFFNGYSPTTLRDWFETYFDGIYCLLTGCTMTGDLGVLGTGSFFNSTLLIDGDIAGGDATLVIEADSSHYACINLTEGNNIGMQICYDGVGVNRFVVSNLYTGYEYFVIDRTTGLIHLNNNTIVTGNITADLFIGSGAELTNLNVTGVMNVTGDFTGYEINISFLSGALGIGGMDLRGDPWYLSGTNFQVADNITASNFIGTFEGNSSIWSRAGTNTFLTNSGDNVGIGTLDPRANLHIAQPQPFLRLSDTDATTDTNTEGGVIIYRGLNTNRIAGFQSFSSSTNEFSLYTDFTGGYITFRTGDLVERMRIKNDGNVGIGTTTPDTKLQVVGNFKSGEDTTNYFALANDGEVSLHGTARVGRHLRVGASSWNHGASAPTEGHDGAFVYLDFDSTSDDECHFTLIVPYRWDSSVDVEFVVDWFYDGVQDNGNVNWALEYKSIKSGEIVTGAGTTINQTSAGTHTTGQMVRTTFTTEILASNLEAGDTLGFKLYRNVSADTLGTDAKLLNTHFHFTQNKLGESL